MLDEDVKIKFIELLKEIAAGDLSNVDKHYGICGALCDSVCDDEIGYSFVQKNCKDWDNFRGTPNIPTGAYNLLGRNWQGEQLALRQSLAQHLLTKLDEDTYVL